MTRRFLLTAASLVALLLAACTVEGVPGLGADDEPTPRPTLALGSPGAEPPHSDLAGMIQQVLPSVVNVRVTSVEFDPLGEARETRGQGSGVIIDPQGIVLTNNHVVQGSTEVKVVFNDDRDPVTGRVLGTAPEKDIAVIQIDDADALTAIEIGRSSGLQLGDDVVAIGFPLGLGGATVTKGIISATERNISISGEFAEELEGLLQTDAAINPGNSGGALVDTAGRLVGINTAAAQAGAAENIGFAIPIDAALPIAQEIVNEPPEDRAWLGVQIRSVTGAGMASELGLPTDVRGALIVGVFPDSPAEEAGLEQGDVIVDVGGRKVSSADDLTTALTRFDPGEVVEVMIFRGDGRESFEAELGRRPASLPVPGSSP